MGNRKRFCYRIDGGEIEFVSKYPRDHSFAYVKAVKETCYRRYLRASGKVKADLKDKFKLLERALREWPIVVEDGRASLHQPLLTRDQDSGFVHERMAAPAVASSVGPKPSAPDASVHVPRPRG